MDFVPYPHGRQSFTQLNVPETNEDTAKLNTPQGVSVEPPSRPEAPLPEAPNKATLAAHAQLAQAKRALEDERQEVRALLIELRQLKSDVLEASSTQLAEILKSFAQRIVGQSLALHPEALPDLVRDAVAQLPGADELTIAVSPDAAERLANVLDGDLRNAVVVDPTITSGVLVRTATLAVDATLDVAMQSLDAAIKTWLADQWWQHDGSHP